MDELIGTVLAVLYRSPERSHAVARVRTPAGEVFTCAGPEAPGSALAPDLAFRFLGRWDDHPKFGRQFRFDAAVLHSPVDRAGVVAYLVALVDRVGQKRAERLWDLYGDRAAAVLRSDPLRVAAQGVLSEEDALAGQAALLKHEATERVWLELLSLTAGRGFGRKLVQEAIGLWGCRAALRVRGNPYLLLLHRLSGAGWKRCDRLWLDLKKPPAHPKRQVLAAVFWMRDEGQGHTWHPATKVAGQIAQACGAAADPRRALRTGERWGRIAIRREGADRHVALSEHAGAEATVAQKVKELLRWSRPTGRRCA